MADKEIKIKVSTNADTAELKEYKQVAEELQKNSKIVYTVDTNKLNSEIKQVEQELQQAKLEAEQLDEALDKAHMNGDDIGADRISDELAEAEARVVELESKLKSKKKLMIEVEKGNIQSANAEVSNLQNKLQFKNKLDIDVDDKEVKQAQREVDKLDSDNIDVDFQIDGQGNLKTTSIMVKELDNEVVTVDFKANDTEIDAVKTEVEQLDNEVVDIPVRYNTSGMDSLKAGAGSAGGAVGGLGNQTRKTGEEVDKLGSKSKSTSANLGILSGAGSMAMGMVGFELANGLAMAGREAINADSKLSYYANRLKMSSQEAGAFRKELQGMQKDFRKVDMNAIGASAEEIAMKSNIKPTADNMREITKMTAVMSSAFVQEGRTQEDAILAVNDALGGQFKRLQELNITEDMLKDAGWSGDLNDQLGLIQAINKTMDDMGYTQTAQDITTLDDAFQALSVAGGQLLASILIPLTPTFINITYAIIGFVDKVKEGVSVLQDMFSNLPAPIQNLITTIGMLGVGAVALGLSFSALGSIVGTIISPFQNLWSYFRKVPDGQELTPFKQRLQSIKDTAGSVKTAIGGLKTKLLGLASDIKGGVISALGTLKTFLTTELIPAVKNAGTAMFNLGKKALQAGYDALASVGSWLAKKGAMIADAIATGYATIAQWALNSALLANPITWIVVAIIALIAVLGYLYFNNEQVRNAINGLWQTLVGLGQYIYGVLVNAWNALVSSLQGFWNYLVGLGSSIQSSVSDTINGVVSFISQIPSRVWEVLSSTITTVGEWGSQLQQAFYDAVSNAVNIVITTLQGIWDYIMTLGGLLPEGVNITGIQIVDSLIAVMGFIATLPLQLEMIFINMIASALGFGNNFVQTMFMTAFNAVNNFIIWISQLPARVGAFLSNVIARASSFAGNFINQIVHAGSSAVSGFINSIGQMASGLANELNNMLSLVGEWASTLPAKFWEAGVNAVKNFLSALGIASPGTMQRMMIWEVTEMGRRIPFEARNLLSNVSDLGRDIVSKFGNPTLKVDTDFSNKRIESQQLDLIANLDNAKVDDDSREGFNQVNNFYFEDIIVDDDKRMQKIADYIQKELDWNNKTAGRTI